MTCPFCGGRDEGVVDSRPDPDGRRVRRRRECRGCGKRFTTHERIEWAPNATQRTEGIDASHRMHRPISAAPELD